MAENDEALVEAIKRAGWWQGSILPASRFDNDLQEGVEPIWWVITSQTCNLYSSDFEKIPVFEMVAAKKIEIDDIDSAVSKGNNPRILHTKAEGDGETVAFEIDIQNRTWLSRRILANLGQPAYEIIDNNRETADWLNNQWLDNFAGWLSRSYTRVTLPDDFNDILKLSKIQSSLDSKLRTNGLYGIYFSLSSAAEDEWTGVLGLMPPPYFLEVLLVSDESVDPEPYVQKLKSQLFESKITAKIGEKEITGSRAEIAKSLGLTIISAGVTGKSIANTYLLEIKSMIRYTLNDYLSRAGAEPA